MQTKRSYFFAGALGEGAENVKRTKNTWHTAQKKIKTRLFLYPFSEIAAGKVPVWAKIKLLRCVFGKRGTKIVRTFFGGRSCAVCQVKKFWKVDLYSPARQRETPPSGFAAHLVLSGPLCPKGISPPRGKSPPFRGGYKEEN